MAKGIIAWNNWSPNNIDYEAEAMDNTKHQPKQMSKAAKAALFSALIFPGAGLWWLKHYWRACIFIIPSGLILMQICRLLAQVIAPVYKKILREAEIGLIDPFDLLGLYVRLYKDVFLALEPHQAQLDFAKYILIACWLCSILSSYFAGKKMELQGAQATATTTKE